MKNIMMVTAALAVLSVSAFGSTDGKVGSVEIFGGGMVKVEIIKADDTRVIRSLVSTGDAKKSQIAAVLTAKSTNADVAFTIGTVGENTGWRNLMIK